MWISLVTETDPSPAAVWLRPMESPQAPSANPAGSEPESSPCVPSRAQAHPVRIWDLPTRLFHWSLASCVLGALVTALASAFACAVFSDVRAGANRKGATAALGVGFVLVALLIAGLSVLVPFIGLLVFLAVAWLAIVRSRRGPDRHAGLRVLR